MHQMWKLNTSISVLEPFINNAKICDKKYICAHCLRRHINLSGRENSTYSAALKLILKKKEKLQKFENKIFSKSKPHSWLAKGKKSQSGFTELVKVTEDESEETKMSVHRIKASDVSAFAEEPGMTFTYKNKCSYDSTVSFDPSLMTSTLLETPSQDTLRDKNIDHKMLNDFNRKVKIKSHSINSHNKFKPKIKVENNIDVGKILPLNAVEIFPMPKRLQQDISNRYLQELSKPQTEIENESEIPNLDFTEILKSSQLKNREKIFNEETTEERASYLAAEDFEKIQIFAPSKEYKFNELLLSYIDVAINTNLQDDALVMLNSLRKKKIWKLFKGHCFLNSYNLLLHSYSEKGDWLFVNKILDWMKIDNVPFNCQTYAAILDCLATIDKKVFESENLWKQEVLKNLRKLYSDNYNLNDLFTKTTLTMVKRNRILETIRVFLPQFEIEPTKINLNSSHVFLENLYKGHNYVQTPLHNAFDTKTIGKLVEEQLLLEKGFSIPVKSIYSSRTRFVSSKDREKYEEMFETWKEAITKGFIESLEKAEAEHEKNPNKFNLYVYLKCLPPEVYVQELLEEVRAMLNFNEYYSLSTSVLYKLLGKRIYLRYQIKKLSDSGVENQMKKVFKKYCSWYFDPSGPAMNSRQEWQMLMQDYLDSFQLESTEYKWPNVVTETLGKYLYNIILQHVKVTDYSKTGEEILVPAFYRIIRYQKWKCWEQIKCLPSLLGLSRKIGFEKLNFQAHHLPMICPPKPWKSTTEGGYLILPTDYVRKPRGIIGKTVDYEKIPNKHLYPTFDSLNVLQSVPWRINEDMLDLILKIFNNGGSEKLGVPKLPENDTIPLSIHPDMTLEERQHEFQRRKKLIEVRNNEYSLWCDALYKLSIANHFRKRVFWFPQNMDFRGRIYPVPPYFNHIGSDLYRCLIMFAKGKPLGPNGLDWLKIHCINLTGHHKKKSVEEKLNFANLILPDILDSAREPLTGKKWWMESEEPWQTLAVCMEINKALSIPDPASYVSHFPVHQDGSCNGLQHYAALGRDKIGAESVNLSPNDVPQDVYTVVTQILDRQRQKDAENGNKIAEILEGFVKRKVIKQTVMTTVYGVTKYGARIQIAGQLKDIEEFPQEHVWVAAEYLTKNVFESLRKMFTSAKEIQEWFLKCACIITKRQDFVQWVSPLGLPILQSYGKLSSKKGIDSTRVVPNSLKQKNAFAPNYVHSLDASHLMLTALFCEQAGITFASIHDSFWTHPSTVDTMNKICRQQFLALHSQPLLNDLAQFFVQCYLDENVRTEKDQEAIKIFKSVPKTGDFDLSTVMNSVYFFN